MDILLYALLGLGAGVLSGLLGIGGAIIIVPSLVYFFHMSQHKAQGTSLGALLAPIGIFAFWTYYKAGNVDGKAAIVIAIGIALGAWVGGIWAQQLSDLALRRVFGVLLLAVGAKMLLQR